VMYLNPNGLNSIKSTRILGNADKENRHRDSDR
jgi:hypothetical protein